MSRDHIGIPRFIEEGFATSGMVASYDVETDRIRLSPISKLGTDVDYYDEDVEHNLLANKVEGEFSKFYKDITSITDIDFIERTINNNKELITQFFSFMYMRAKKTLETVNKNSLSSRLFGDINHSELLRIQSNILVNPLKMIGEDCDILALYNFSSIQFINNSLGIGALISKENKVTFFVPLNARVGLMFCDKSYSNNSQCFYIEPGKDNDAKRLNKAMVEFEYDYGNGFLFANKKNDLAESVTLFRKRKTKMYNCVL